MTENVIEKPPPRDDVDLELLHRIDIIRNNLQSLHSVDSKIDMTSEEVGAYLSKIHRLANAAKQIYYVPERFEKPIEALCNIADLLSLITKHIGEVMVRLIRTKENTLSFVTELTYRVITYEERKVLRDLTHLKVSEERLPDSTLRFLIQTDLLDPLTFTDEVGKVLKLLLWIDEKEKETPERSVVKRSIEEFLTIIENSDMVTNNLYQKVDVKYIQPLPAEHSMWEFEGQRFIVLSVATLFKASKGSQKTLVVFQNREGEVFAVSSTYWNENFKKVATKEPIPETPPEPQKGEEYIGPAGEFVHVYDVIMRKSGERVVLHGGRDGEPQRATPLQEFLGYKKV